MVSKNLDQLNLTLCKGLDDLPCQCKDADGFALASKRNADNCSMSAKPLILAGKIALRIVAEHVSDVDRDTGCRRTCRGATTVGRVWMSPCEGLKFGGETVIKLDMKVAIFPEKNHAFLGFT